jgi:hypothetical protein
VRLQGLDGLGAGGVGLVHDELNILQADTRLIDLLIILNSSGISLNSGSGVGILEDILGSLELGLQAVHVLGLTLAKDDVGIRVQGSVDIGLGNGQKGGTGAADGDTGDTLDLLKTKLGEGLAGLDLTTGLDTGGGRGNLLLVVGLVRVDLLDGRGLVLNISPVWLELGSVG